jgi:hypothetical protein
MIKAVIACRLSLLIPAAKVKRSEAKECRETREKSAGRLRR